MEIFHVASMRARKFFDKTGKFLGSMHRKFLQNIHATYKIFQNFKEFYEILQNMLENFRKISENFTKYSKNFRKKNSKRQRNFSWKFLQHPLNISATHPLFTCKNYCMLHRKCSFFLQSAPNNFLKTSKTRMQLRLG